MKSHISALGIVGMALVAAACGDAQADSYPEEQTDIPATTAQRPSQARDSGCRTGGGALANVYVRANPIFAHYFGSLESFVANNAEHFRADGDAIRCASALSRAFFNRAIQLYDPTDYARQAELRAQLGAMGVSPGPQESTASGEAFGVSMQLSRLARVLPAAADGDYGPLQTPTTELEQMQLAAGEILAALLRSPEMAEIMAMMEPLIRELANLEYRSMEQAAATLASSE